jgi:hypothetical protein
VSSGGVAGTIEPLRFLLLPLYPAAELQAPPPQGRIMAKIIKFYVPSSFQNQPTKRISSDQRGRVIPFALPRKKTA